MGEKERRELQGRLDFDACLSITASYLEAQGWQLVDAGELAARIWPDLQGRGLQGPEARQAVETAVWQNYAAVLYDNCRQPGDARGKRAWTELQHWLERQARAYLSHPQEREEVVQEALISLHDAFERDKLQAPRALWAYALRALRNAGVSRHRWRTAQKRDAEKTESLQENEERRDGSPTRQRPLTAPPGSPPSRPLEESVIDRERRRRLQAFFEQHLKSELQVAVVRAFYLENQTPAEIAALLHKTPHEVRMIKARALNALRALPQADLERLLDILDAPGEQEDDDAAGA